MKRHIRGLVLVGMFGSSGAMAESQATPLLVRDLTVGSNVLVPRAYSETCEIFAGEVIVWREYYGPSQSTADWRSITFPEHIKLAIEEAAAEPVVEKPGLMCDDSVTLKAMKQSGSDAPEIFLVYSSGSCRSPSVSRDGPAAKKLVHFANEVCAQIPPIR